MYEEVQLIDCAVLTDSLSIRTKRKAQLIKETRRGGEEGAGVNGSSR